MTQEEAYRVFGRFYGIAGDLREAVGRLPGPAECHTIERMLFAYPDLLEACEAMLRVIWNYQSSLPPEQFNALYEQTKSAVAKARTK